MQLIIQALMLVWGIALLIISHIVDNPLDAMQSHIEGTMWIICSIIYGIIPTKNS